MKNIQYRIIDKRYIGRKQINGKILTVYAKTQKDCLEKLKEALKKQLPLTLNKKKPKIYLKIYT
ncbi:MAG TPA: hypothetical protein IAA62_00540 [Candidatus Caccopulliclostridium gallistercoris]|uniref:Uncharacterized protein n=1 Tax=Candidatus Caccopulliclostridium gallistercoris TaxID=2840719 RepID=A0A9D1SYL5_9FIRM|nr:hypothetical protein [Candidatus Caccopulliclostridium gallistercoris]